MISKYFLWTSVLILNILLFSSCLNSSNNNYEDLPPDPQIYAISLSSKTDSTGVLPDISFSIDQIKDSIFNKESLPYLFHVDSVMIKVSGSSSYYSFAQLEISLDKDCTYVWNRTDSIPLLRLKEIITTSPNGINKKTYKFKLNIYQSDPYIIDWKPVSAANYLPSQVESQRTVAYDNNFYTYFRSGSQTKAVKSPISETPQWKEETLTGIPDNLRLSSLITSGNTIYGIDETSGSVYKSTNATAWSEVPTQYEVKAIYGQLPFSTKGTVLLVVNQGGTLKFAKGNEGLSEIQLLNDVPANMPITDFSAVTVESSTVYARKFIFVSGGKKIDNNTLNNDIWVLQGGDGAINYFTSKKPEEVEMEGSSLFFYDDQPYLITRMTDGDNVLLHSRNYGAEWVKAGENQAFPEQFTGRKKASVITDANNNIWIFGGISSSEAQLKDIWRGRLNKFN